MYCTHARHMDAPGAQTPIKPCCILSETDVSSCCQSLNQPCSVIKIGSKVRAVTYSARIEELACFLHVEKNKNYVSSDQVISYFMRDLEEELLRSPHRANSLQYMSHARFICMQSAHIFKCFHMPLCALHNVLYKCL